MDGPLNQGSSYFPAAVTLLVGTKCSPIVLGFEGLLRIAGRFVGMGQAMEVVGGGWGQEMFSKCGAEERTSRNRPVFCAI